ncbi:hypothetical protein [Streptomyces mirabilis]|uniref:hypothetical protein n=1 Tax=Streptomyces mirabilis TaxID=68239 RepID=UPI00369BE389
MDNTSEPSRQPDVFSVVDSCASLLGSYKLLIADTAHTEEATALEELKRAAQMVIRLEDAGWEFDNTDGLALLCRKRLPLVLLQSMAAAMRKAKGIDSGSLARARNRVPPQLYARMCDLGVADGHVHISAGLPFDGLFMLALFTDRNTHSVRMERLGSFTDERGIPFRVQMLLAAANPVFMLLNNYVAKAEAYSDFENFLVRNKQGMRSALFELVRDRGLWRGAAEAARQNPISIDEDLVDALFARAIDSGSGLTHSIEDPSAHLSSPEFAPINWESDDLARRSLELKIGLFSHYLHAPSDALYHHHLVQLIRTEALLHRAVTQSDQSGLEAFLECAERQSIIRSSLPRAVRQKKRKILVQQGLKYLNSGRCLSRIELRSAEGRPGTNIFSRKLATEFAEYMEGYRDYLAAEGTTLPLLSIPLCLLKIREDPPKELVEDVLEAPCRFRTSHLWETLEAVVEALSSCPTAERYFGGLDVAGDENAMPNWVYAALYHEYKERLVYSRPGLCPSRDDYPLSCRVHAGELFNSPLQGIRRIGEALKFGKPADEVRIGHALALSSNAPWDNLRDEPLEEVLDDLSWALMMLSGSATRTITAEAESLLISLAKDFFRPDIHNLVTSENITRAYEARYKVEDLRDVGFLSPDPEREQWSWPNRKVSLALPDAWPGWKKLARVYFTETLLDLQATWDKTPEQRQTLEELYRQARIPLLRELQNRGTVIETCPTSNLIIGGFPSYDDHPVFELTSEGVSCTINTDDPGIFHVTIDEEIAHVWQAAQRKVTDSFEARFSWLEKILMRNTYVVSRGVQERSLDDSIDACLRSLKHYISNGANGID